MGCGSSNNEIYCCNKKCLSSFDSSLHNLTTNTKTVGWYFSNKHIEILENILKKYKLNDILSIIKKMLIIKAYKSITKGDYVTYCRHELFNKNII